jgi:hypothetical protein
VVRVFDHCRGPRYGGVDLDVAVSISSNAGRRVKVRCRRIAEL